MPVRPGGGASPRDSSVFPHRSARRQQDRAACLAALAGGGCRDVSRARDSRRTVVAQETRSPAEGSRWIALPTFVIRVAAVRRTRGNRWSSATNGLQTGAGILFFRLTARHFLAQRLDSPMGEHDALPGEAGRALLLGAEETLQDRRRGDRRSAAAVIGRRREGSPTGSAGHDGPPDPSATLVQPVAEHAAPPPAVPAQGRRLLPTRARHPLNHATSGPCDPYGLARKRSLDQPRHVGLASP